MSEGAGPVRETVSAVPVSAAERRASIGVVRGFSLFGILVINITVVSHPTMNIFNPLIAGGFKGANFGYWWISHMFFLQKFMTIFSMLFGAGIVLMSSRIEARGGSPGSQDPAGREGRL